jgi:hypothetical protein
VGYRIQSEILSKKVRRTKYREERINRGWGEERDDRCREPGSVSRTATAEKEQRGKIKIQE